MNIFDIQVFSKKILIKSRNTDKYADYYLLFEKSIKYYNDSQLIRKDKYNIILQEKVDTLEEKINDINKFKVLKLEKNDTLEKFVIVRDDRKKSI